MSIPDAVADARNADPGAGHTDHGEEPGARPEGPPLDDDDPKPEGTKARIREWAHQTPRGSHLDHDPKDFLDLETGGPARIAFHLQDFAGADGVGYPNGPGVVVGALETYIMLLRGDLELPSPGGDGDE